MDATEITAEVSASFAPGTRPSIRARVESPHVHLDDLIALQSAETDGSPAVAESEGSSLWDSDMPLPFELLHEVDLDIAIDIERITGRGWPRRGGDATNTRATGR